MIARQRLLAGVAGTALLALITLLLHAFAPFVEYGVYDLLLRLKPSRNADSVAIVAIDSKSIAEIGGFPWPRGAIARLADSIRAAEVRVAAFDFVFPPRDDSAGNKRLASAFERTDNLILPFQMHAVENRAAVAIIPAEAFAHRFLVLKRTEELAARFFYSGQRIDISDPLFFRHAGRSGYINVSTSASGQKLREIVHVIRAGDEYFPSFAVAAAAAWHGLEPQQLALDGSHGVILGADTLPLSRYAGSALLNFRGPPGTIQTISAVDLMTGSIDKSALRDKIVLIGITDPAAAPDLFVTPGSAQFPGVEIWATAIADIIQNASIQRSGGLLAAIPWILALIVFPGLAFAVPGHKKIFALICGAAACLLGAGLSAGLFVGANLFMNPDVVFYAWAFNIMWLAAEKANPSLADAPIGDLEPTDLGDADALAPPASSELLAAIPSSATAAHVAERISDQFPELHALTPHSGKHAAENGSAPASERAKDADKAIEQFRQLAGGAIVRFLGSGGMADVYLIWHPRLEVYRAIKVIKPGQSEQLLDRFETEIRIFANLNHPNIVQCYGAGEWHGLPYLEMEYVPGAAMDSVLRKCGRLAPEQALAIGILIARALHYAHQRTVTVYGKTYKGVIHRDLKPANVMLSRAGKIKLTDFGIARPQAVSLHTLDSGKVVGTLPYLAPEQLDGNELSAQTDVYALGAMLYELVTGRRAYPQPDVTALVNAKARGHYQSIHRLGIAPEPMAEALEKAMAQKAKDRFESAAAMSKALERILRNLVKGDDQQFISGLVRRFWS